MARLIDKDASLAEIERLKKEEGWCQVGKDTADVYYARGFRFACERIKDTLDTLEVKEVDLKEEIDKIWKPRFSLGWDDKSLLSVSYKGFEVIAKHFFELGLKAQKGE